MAGLTAKHQAFVDYFSDDTNKETYNNAKRSYMAAYPKSSEKAAESHSIRLVRNGKILKALAAIRTERLGKSEVTREEVTGNARWLVQEGITCSKGQDVAAGNLQLGRIIGAFDDRLSVTGEQEQQQKYTEEQQAKIRLMTDNLLADMHKTA